MNTNTRRLITVIGAAAAALALWIVAVPLAGVDLEAGQGDGAQQVQPFMVVAGPLLAGFAGWALLAVLERRTSRAGRIWTVTAAAVLAVSMLGPLGGAGAASKLVLLGMHLVVAAVLIPGFTGGGKREPDGAPAAAGAREG